MKAIERGMEAYFVCSNKKCTTNLCRTTTKTFQGVDAYTIYDKLINEGYNVDYKVYNPIIKCKKCNSRMDRVVLD